MRSSSPIRSLFPSPSLSLAVIHAFTASNECNLFSLSRTLSTSLSLSVMHAFTTSNECNIFPQMTRSLSLSLSLKCTLLPLARLPQKTFLVFYDQLFYYNYIFLFIYTYIAYQHFLSLIS